jgi:hypothetical protein
MDGSLPLSTIFSTLLYLELPSVLDMLELNLCWNPREPGQLDLSASCHHP